MFSRLTQILDFLTQMVQCSLDFLGFIMFAFDLPVFFIMLTFVVVSVFPVMRMTDVKKLIPGLVAFVL